MAPRSLAQLPRLSCAQVGSPRFRLSELNGRRGTIIEIPNCTAPTPVEVTDKQGLPAKAWDFVVHPKAVHQALAMPAIKQSLIETVKWGVTGATPMKHLPHDNAAVWFVFVHLRGTHPLQCRRPKSRWCGPLAAPFSCQRGTRPSGHTTRGLLGFQGVCTKQGHCRLMSRSSAAVSAS
jgi:hypothetical protein